MLFPCTLRDKFQCFTRQWQGDPLFATQSGESLSNKQSQVSPLKVSVKQDHSAFYASVGKLHGLAKNLQLGYNSALNVSSQMTNAWIISQSSHREGDAPSSRNSVSFLPSYTHQESISPTSVVQCFYLPHPFHSSCLPNSSHFIRQNRKNKRLWEYLEGV